jgi:hypothetical protein
MNLLLLVWLKMRRVFMNEIYAMRRANGDWFALKDHGRLRVPLFHTSHDAMMTRLRNVEMLLFKPVALDTRLLGEIMPVGAGSDVDFCLVNDPFASLKHSSLVEHSELVSLMNNPTAGQIIPRNGNSSHVSAVSTPPQSEWWN